MFLVETILLLQVEGFQPPFFVERKYIEYSFLIWNILLLIKGQYGLVSLAIYPISTLSVIDLSSESTCTCLCSIKAPDGIFCLFEKLYHVLLRLSVGVVCDVLYFFSTLCQVMVQLLLQIFVQASCHGRFESGPRLTRVWPGSDAGLTHCKSGLAHGLCCAILGYDASMNQKGSLLFCAFNGCPQELDFKTGWRKACHNKGKSYGALKQNKLMSRVYIILLASLLKCKSQKQWSRQRLNLS